MSFEYIRKYYAVPAERGRRVEIDGKPGVIACDIGHYIGVLMDENKPTCILPYHPVSKVKYLGMGDVRSMTRSQQRYRNFLAVADVYENFGEYLRWEHGLLPLAFLWI